MPFGVRFGVRDSSCAFSEPTGVICLTSYAVALNLRALESARDNDPLWPRFKPARNRLRKIERVSFVLLAIQRLFEVHAKPRELMSTYQPWNLLTAIRWALAERDPLSHRLPSATQNDLAVVLNVIHEIEGETTLAGPGAVILLLRRMSFQQFWLQGKEVHGSDIARIELLFGELSTMHSLQRQFEAATGMSITEFSDLALCLLTAMHREAPPRIITEKTFELIAPSLRPGMLDSFLTFLSRTPAELPEWLASVDSSNRSLSAQILLPTPFVLAPLLRLPSGYFVYHPTLLLRALFTLVYRTLKSPNPQEFGNRFGPLFEAYVRRCLVSAGVAFEDEKALQARLPAGSKCVDFQVIGEDGTRILIEAKSAEMPAVGRVTGEADIVLGAIKHSALKAVTQAFSALPHLERGLDPKEKTPETFVIVITYDELHLGSNRHFRQVYGEEFIPKLEIQFGYPLPIPVEHLFFLSILDFEYLLSCARAGNTSIARALRHARDEDSSPATQKFDFGQHFETLCAPGPHLPIIAEGLDRIWKRVSARLPESERSKLERI